MNAHSPAKARTPGYSLPNQRATSVQERRRPDRQIGPPRGNSERRASAQLARFSPADRQRYQRLFLRGTNLQPPGTRLQSCVAGSKQSILVDLLGRPDGATMEELLAALAGGRKSWTEAAVRSGFGWDLKNKGYGVRSEFDALGVERFHLIAPEGQAIPPHAPVRKISKKK